MAELAKTHITVTDDSAYAAGIDTLIPLYVFATEQDKVVDETTGEIATGTVKSLAGQLSVVTSRKDVVDKFGAPKFYESNGTVLQGDERNEYGLYGLFDAMGSSSLAYALRADIDLKQLSPVEEEPTSSVKNGLLWLDLTNTSLGMFEYKNAPTLSKSWDNPITDYAVANDESKLPEIDPYEVEEMEGKFGVVFEKSEDESKKITGITQTLYIVEDGKWKIFDKHIFYRSSTKYPGSEVADSTETGDIVTDGDVWIKTTSANNGSNYVLKKWSATSRRWNESTLRLFVTDSDSTAEEKAKDFYGDNLKSGIIALFCEENNPEISFKVYSEEDKLWKNINTNIIISYGEPRSFAKEGTLWFNDDLKVDIMVNNGTSWVGFNDNSAYPNAKIYVTSEDPSGNVDFAGENSIWVNSANFPELRRYIGGEWMLVDLTDQLSPDGVIFADARYYSGISNLNGNDVEYIDIQTPTYDIDSETGEIKSNLLISNLVDPDCPKASTYSKGMLLFNTRFSTNNVKEFKESPFDGLYTQENDYYEYTVDTKIKILDSTVYDGSDVDVHEDFFKNRWVTASGNAADGSGLFGRDAQRKMVVKALASAVVSNEDIRTYDYDFFFACCPGYPELDDELINLNKEKKEMFEIISDTPKTLRPDGKAIQEWGTNANNAVSHGTEGRILKNEYVTRQYPPMGLASNVDGAEIAVPSSIAKMKNLLVLPRGQIAAGTQNGQVTNLASVGYITEEQEYASVVLNDGLGEVCTAQSINPIMPRRNTGLLFWGEATENPITSSLSDEHAIITLLRLKRQLEAACLPFFFRINNASLRNEFHKVLQDILNTFVGTGEIYDYALEVESENTSERINRKELWAAIAIEIAKGVEQIYIPIKVVATGALSE